MGNYTVIADVGQALVRLLRLHMAEEGILRTEQVGLCSPRDFGDYRLGICLYDIQQSNRVPYEGRRLRGENIQTNASMYLDLYYLIIPFVTSDWRYRAAEEQRLLGKVLQVLWDYPLLNTRTYETEERVGVHTIQLELPGVELEEQTKIWNSLNENRRNAVYCRVAAVELESTRSKMVKRVRNIQVQMEQGGSDEA